MRIRKLEKIPAPSSAGDQFSKQTANASPKRSVLADLLKSVFNNPNLCFQIMVIILTLSGENAGMERKIAGMGTALEKIRGIAEVLAAAMGSMKTAAAAPRKIKQILE